MQPLYDPEAVRPMWEELAMCGVKPLRTAADVDETLAHTGTTLIIVNSICGCAAGSARPGVTQALQGAVIPDHLTTVFAGVDMEATQRVRQRMPEIAPSSPSVGLFKDGVLVYALERRNIERRSPDEIAAELEKAFQQHCTRKGPSVPPEVYRQVVHAVQCGSQIPSGTVWIADSKLSRLSRRDLPALKRLFGSNSIVVYTQVLTQRPKHGFFSVDGRPACAWCRAALGPSLIKPTR
jgi:putative YphP/YqiW family bacilliredoxin